MISTKQNWTVEHELVSGGFAIELRRYIWPKCQVLASESPMLNFALASSPIGEMRPVGSGSRTPFRKLGRLVFAPPAVPYDMRGPGGERRAISCRIDPRVFNRLTEDFCWDEYQLAACADVRETTIQAMLLALAREARSPGFASDVMLEGAGMAIAARLARSLREPGANHRSKVRSLSPRMLDEINELIENNNCTNLKIIAAHCKMSVRTLTRNYRATTGQTVARTIAEARVRQAMELLRDQSVPIKVVAGRTGFSSAASFTTAFRRSTGFTPGAFREYVS